MAYMAKVKTCSAEAVVTPKRLKKGSIRPGDHGLTDTNYTAGKLRINRARRKVNLFGPRRRPLSRIRFRLHGLATIKRQNDLPPGAHARSLAADGAGLVTTLAKQREKA